MAKRKVSRLMPHNKVAKLFGTTPETLRARVKRGVFPLPHSTERSRPDSDVGLILYYAAEDIEYRLEKGLWPSHVRFAGDSLSEEPDDER